MKRFKTFVEQMAGSKCSCCGNMIDEKGKCGCGPDCPHCGGQHTIDEGYKASSEKSKFGGYRAHLKNPEGRTSYMGSAGYKKPEYAKGEAQAYHDAYFGGPGRANNRAADRAVAAYRAKHKDKILEESKLDEAMDQKKFSAGAKAMKAYAQKYGGVDKKEFMEVSKLLDQIGRVNILQAGQLLTRLNRLIDGMDTDVRERMFIELKKVGLVESFEALDEISKKTLGSYVKKASDDRAQNALNVGKTGKMNFKGLKRSAGIRKAVDRLTK